MTGAGRRIAEIRAGLLLLTRLPGGHLADPVPTMGESAWSWPLAGFVVGLCAAVVHAGAVALGLPPLPAACLAVLALVVATGGMHEDGLADLADSAGGRTRERRLEIMRDSRIGSFGALALGLSLLIRVTSIAALPVTATGPALIALSVASRSSLPTALLLLPPARADGLGRSARNLRPAAAAVAIAFGLGALFLLLSPGPAATSALFIVLAAGATGLWAYARLGGQTGDVLGAMQQAGELAGWLALSASSVRPLLP